MGYRTSSGSESSRNSELLYVCNAGIGAVSSAIFPQVADKHAISLYAGLLLAHTYIDSRAKGVGVGLGYVYFANGMSRTGWNFGFMPYVERRNNNNNNRYFLQVGYQFN